MKTLKIKIENGKVVKSRELLSNEWIKDWCMFYKAEDLNSFATTPTVYDGWWKVLAHNDGFFAAAV